MIKISDLGSILGVFAHPDDETFICGGLLAMAVGNGQEVTCITATKGEEGVQDESRWPKKDLANIRNDELESSLKILGIKTHHWLGYLDGQCAVAPDDEAVGKILNYIAKYKPDTIITFAPDGLTGHADHQAVCRWSKLAVARAGLPIKIYFGVCPKEPYEKYMKTVDNKFNIYFNINNPKVFDEETSDIYLQLDEETINKKVNSFKAQTSQSDKMFKAFGDELFKKAFSAEAFVSADREDTNWKVK